VRTYHLGFIRKRVVPVLLRSSNSRSVPVRHTWSATLIAATQRASPFRRDGESAEGPGYPSGTYRRSEQTISNSGCWEAPHAN
jgi:hypothetical protein